MNLQLDQTYRDGYGFPHTIVAHVPGIEGWVADEVGWWYEAATGLRIYNIDTNRPEVGPADDYYRLIAHIPTLSEG